ncbi:MAG: rRNA maturation RNase YbeY [Patescibacteria group bacterium]|nr:rRNA maturation RNase YbeY [Patescibacteria group bacterium]
MINIFSSSRYKINKEKIKKSTDEFFLAKKIEKNILVNIAFIGKNKMKYLSLNYKNENIALPVLSFFYNEKQEDKILLGEIFICYPQAVLLAAERNKKVDEIINNLLIHGLENLIKNL